MASNVNVVRSNRAAEPVGAFPHARRAGEFLFLSGIGPRVRGAVHVPGTVLGAAGSVIVVDFEAQCRAVFANVRAVLDEAGAAWTDLVDVTVFLTDMARDFETFNCIWAEEFADVDCCRTTVEVLSMPTQIAIELKCVAHLARAVP
jgi:2-aminomuconate deaminase